MTEQEKFNKSIEFSLKYEGAFNWVLKDGKPVLKSGAKNDTGGLTSYGVTNNTLQTAYKQGIVSHNDITKLTVEEAKLIYKKNGDLSSGSPTGRHGCPRR